MYSYVTPADDAPVRIFGHRAGRGGRFWGAFLATFARHWYTGKRFLDEISERFLNTQKLPKAQIREEHYTAMSHDVTLAEGAPRGFGAHF